MLILAGEELAPEAPEAPRVHLNAGEPAPEISLPDLDGNEVAVDFSGKQTAVLFWSPSCGFCQRMVDEIRSFEADPPERAPDLLIVSNGGDAERNKAAGFTSSHLLNPDFAVGRSYGATGTPSAVLVDTDGHIANELVVGARKIYELLGHVTIACRQCLDECDEQGGGAACRTVCEMGGQCN
jgi:hypothetical protein